LVLVSIAAFLLLRPPSTSSTVLDGSLLCLLSTDIFYPYSLRRVYLNSKTQPIHLAGDEKCLTAVSTIVDNEVDLRYTHLGDPSQLFSKIEVWNALMPQYDSTGSTIESKAFDTETLST
jgi:hypothetical protein